MNARRLALSLTAVAIGTLLACGHGGESPDPATAASPDDSASASSSASASEAASPGSAPNMDDVADDGSCAGPNCLRRCDNKGRPLDCTEAGKALRQGLDGLKQDPARAVSYLDKACGLKSREACAVLAQMFTSGEGGTPKDLQRSLILLDDACDQGLGAACDDLARRYDAGSDGAKKDHAKAIGYFASGCAAEASDETACASFADALAKKDKDAGRSLDGWKMKCKAKKGAPECAAIDRLKKKS